MNSEDVSLQKAAEVESGTAQGRSVLLFGEILADMFPDGSVLGGAPFNVARHLAAFGLNPVLVSRIGNDVLGDEIVAEMTADGMSRAGLQVDARKPTGRVAVHMDDRGHRFEILPDQAYDFIEAGQACAAAVACGPSMVYFGTLSQRGEESRRALEAVLDAVTCPRFVDINLREPWYTEESVRFSLRQADILKLNAEELMTLGHLLGLASHEPEDRVLALMRDFGIGRVIVTCGEEGAWLVEKGGEWTATTYENRKIDVLDTVGAGDGFAAVSMLGILSGWPMHRTLNRAEAFARAICGIRGAVPADDGFYRPFLQEWTP